MIAQKLRVKDGMTLYTINAPLCFAELFSDISVLNISPKAKKFEQIHWFVNNKAQMEKNLNKVMNLLNKDVICWCYYPKATSKMQTDLSRDKGWNTLLAKEIQWLSLISFNDTWSAFSFRVKTEEYNKTDIKVKEREIFNYVDPIKKTIILPEDFKTLLKNNPLESDFFNQLSFSNRKEYVEWIVTAKRTETRNNRLKESIKRLSCKWKNPANS